MQTCVSCATCVEYRALPFPDRAPRDFGKPKLKHETWRNECPTGLGTLWGTLLGVGPRSGGSPWPPPAGGVDSYNHHDIGEEDGVEASVVVCESLKPPRPCHPEN